MFSPYVNQCFVTCAMCCNIISQGCSLGYPGVLLPQLKDSGINTTKDQDSWIASVIALTALIGVAVAPPVMDRLGRKVAAYSVVALALMGWVVLAFAYNVTTLLCGRVIQGIAFGVIMPLRPIMIGEYTSPRFRGSFLTTISLSQTIGVGVVHLIGSLVNWKYTAIICCSFNLIGLVMTILSPESPSWLALRGKYDACREAFHWLRGKDEEEELEKMIQTRIAVVRVKEAAEKVSKCKKLQHVAKKKEVYLPVIISMHLYILAMFSGGITLGSYSYECISAMVGTAIDFHFWMIQLDIWRITTNTIAVFSIDHMPRRTMMFASCAVSIISHVGIASYSYARENGYVDIAWIALLLLNLQISSVGFGMVPMANVIAGEIYPLEYRGMLSPVSCIMVAATIFTILKSFPGLLASVALYGVYIVFGVTLVYGTIVTWFLLPETKGRTLQEIEEHFRGRPIAPLVPAPSGKLTLDDKTDEKVEEKLR